MNIEANIRKLARSHYWQELYSASKESSGIQLFENNFNFSGLQTLMLYWLRVYNMLYKEKAEKEWTQLDDDLIKDDDRVDAFLHWRAKEIDKKIKESKLPPKRSKKSFRIWDGKKSEQGSKK